MVVAAAAAVFEKSGAIEVAGGEVVEVLQIFCWTCSRRSPDPIAPKSCCWHRCGLTRNWRDSRLSVLPSLEHPDIGENLVDCRCFGHQLITLFAEDKALEKVFKYKLLIWQKNLGKSLILINIRRLSKKFWLISCWSIQISFHRFSC